MPPFCNQVSEVPAKEPRRLVLVPLCCFYCGHNTEYEVLEWRITHLFGLFHCAEHTTAAKRDCETYMRDMGIVCIRDARDHHILGPFLTALGNKIPILRSSGAVDNDWRIPYLDEVPIIWRSKTTEQWGFNLTNFTSDKFVPLSQFRDPRIVPYLSEELKAMLDTVETTLVEGIYT